MIRLLFIILVFGVQTLEARSIKNNCPYPIQVAAGTPTNWGHDGIGGPGSASWLVSEGWYVADPNQTINVPNQYDYLYIRYQGKPMTQIKFKHGTIEQNNYDAVRGMCLNRTKRFKFKVTTHDSRPGGKKATPVAHCLAQGGLWMPFQYFGGRNLTINNCNTHSDVANQSMRYYVFSRAHDPNRKNDKVFIQKAPGVWVLFGIGLVYSEIEFKEYKRDSTGVFLKSETRGPGVSVSGVYQKPGPVISGSYYYLKSDGEGFSQSIPGDGKWKKVTPQKGFWRR